MKPVLDRSRTVCGKGDDARIASVERGEVLVSAADDVATRPKEQQSEIVAKGERETSRKEVLTVAN